MMEVKHASMDFKVAASSPNGDAIKVTNSVMKQIDNVLLSPTNGVLKSFESTKTTLDNCISQKHLSGK